MFDLPLEKKMEYLKPTTLEGGYIGGRPSLPLYESFGIFGDKDVPAFQELMWPEGRPGFNEALNSINAMMLELNKLLLRMIFDQNVICNLRAAKYRLPKENEEPIGLMTILCQNSVQGLEFLTREGEWVTLNIPKGNLVIIVGDALQVWSNGRLHAVKHRVTITGDQERHSCAFFSIPKDGVTIGVPEKLVDENHPKLYRPFVYSEYRKEFATSTRCDALDIYAGV